jgi:hypothetical protein
VKRESPPRPAWNELCGRSYETPIVNAVGLLARPLLGPVRARSIHGVEWLRCFTMARLPVVVAGTSGGTPYRPASRLAPNLSTDPPSRLALPSLASCTSHLFLRNQLLLVIGILVHYPCSTSLAAAGRRQAWGARHTPAWCRRRFTHRNGGLLLLLKSHPWQSSKPPVQHRAPPLEAE